MAHQIMKGSLSFFDEDSQEWQELGTGRLNLEGARTGRWSGEESHIREVDRQVLARMPHNGVTLYTDREGNVTQEGGHWVSAAYLLRDYQQQALDDHSRLYGAPRISISGYFTVKMSKFQSNRLQQHFDRMAAEAPLPTLVYRNQKPGVALSSFFAWRLLLGTPNPVKGTL